MNPCNAVIVSSRLGISDNYSNCLELSLELRLQDGGGCCFSVYGPYGEEYPHNTFAYSLKRILDICGVDNIEGLVGQPIRAKFKNNGELGDIIIGIGHFLKDDWFIPREEKLYQNF